MYLCIYVYIYTYIHTYPTGVHILGWMSSPFRPFSVLPFYSFGLALGLLCFPQSVSPFLPTHRSEDYAFRFKGHAKENMHQSTMGRHFDHRGEHASNHQDEHATTHRSDNYAKMNMHQSYGCTCGRHASRQHMRQSEMLRGANKIHTQLVRVAVDMFIYISISLFIHIHSR